MGDFFCFFWAGQLEKKDEWSESESHDGRKRSTELNPPASVSQAAAVFVKKEISHSPSPIEMIVVNGDEDVRFHSGHAAEEE